MHPSGLVVPGIDTGHDDSGGFGKFGYLSNQSWHIFVGALFVPHTFLKISCVASIASQPCRLVEPHAMPFKSFVMLYAFNTSPDGVPLRNNVDLSVKSFAVKSVLFVLLPRSMGRLKTPFAYTELAVPSLKCRICNAVT